MLLTSAYGQKNDISKIEEAIKMRIDSSWTISMDTVDIRKDAFEGGIFLGRVQIKKYKEDKLVLLLCKSLNDYLLEKEILDHQLSASCRLSEDYYLLRSVLRIDNYYLFLPMYPCWSGYSKDAQLLIKELAEKTGNK